MSINNSGYNFQLYLIASVTFPIGFSLTEFADDSDPFDVPQQQIADKAMTLNGDLIFWSKANPINVNVSVVANGKDDTLLSLLLEANRVARGKTGANDVITLTGYYPSGKIITYINGVITDGMAGTAVASSGRLKSKTFSFAFENRAGI